MALRGNMSRSTPKNHGDKNSNGHPGKKAGKGPPATETVSAASPPVAERMQLTPPPVANRSVENRVFPQAKRVSDEAVRQRAYQKWEAAGKPKGADMRFWLEAKKELYNGLVPEEQVRFRAYLKWEAAGKPKGQDMRFWVEATEELLQQK
jgi:hypothetical protein